jgi:hypothetical protein
MTYIRTHIGPAIRPALRLWLPIAVATTTLAALTYGAVQQDLRLTADDPQQQMAEDAATQLNAGATPASVTPATVVDIRNSLAPYLMVYDGQGNLLASSAELDGKPPTYPTRAFADAQKLGVDTITWDTLTGVRGATVIVPYKGGFVVAGRSLRLVEQRSDHILQLVLFVWIVALLGSAGAAAFGVVALPNK